MPHGGCLLSELAVPRGLLVFGEKASSMVALRRPSDPTYSFGRVEELEELKAAGDLTMALVCG